MQITVLTTGAVRRRYFVETLQKLVPISRVLIETRNPPPPIPTAHPLDDERKRQEQMHWYDGSPPVFEDIAETQYFETLNDSGAISALRELNPDVVLVYGTGPLGMDVIGQCPDACLNFHNGDPEFYRGLDCHLWPLYHRDFGALKMTLHKIEPTLDTGDIVDRRPVPLSKGMPLEILRRTATELTITMAMDALKTYQQKGRFDAQPQQQKGRYYSHMPAVLKGICIRNFKTYTANL